MRVISLKNFCWGLLMTLKGLACPRLPRVSTRPNLAQVSGQRVFNHLILGGLGRNRLQVPREVREAHWRKALGKSSFRTDCSAASCPRPATWVFANPVARTSIGPQENLRGCGPCVVPGDSDIQERAGGCALVNFGLTRTSRLPVLRPRLT